MKWGYLSLSLFALASCSIAFFITNGDSFVPTLSGSSKLLNKESGGNK